MDAVRFGRALGFGARQAAKTVVAAVDAATAEKPSVQRTGALSNSTSEVLLTSKAPVAARPVASQRSAAQPLGEVARIVSEGLRAKRGLSQGGRRFRQAAFGPFVRLSGVLMLEVAGVFFGIFALYGLSTVLRLRTHWHTGMPHHREWVGGVLMLAVFGYFCVSSFVRARRRERQQ